MSRIATPIDVTVEFITPPKDGTYGPYCGVKFKSTDGQEIWKNYGVDSEELGSLTKGDRLQLIPVEKDGKLSHQILFLGTPPATTPAPKPQVAPTSQPQTAPASADKRSIASRADELAKFYRYCFDLASREMGGQVSADGVAPIAIAIFQQVLSE